MTIENEIKSNNSKVFRRAYLKRRLATSGLFETDWQEITSDVQKWGKFSTALDNVRVNVFKFSNVSMQLSNYTGKYNSADDQSSIWYGYAGQQRTLLKVEAGFTESTLGANGIWINNEYPTSSVIFTGVISGDMNVTSENQINLSVKPLTQVFVDFAAKNLIYPALPTGGMAASAFIELLRDQTDGTGFFVFRPFFGDTTTNWVISTTTANYGALNPSQEKGVYGKNVWEIITQLAECEGFAPYASKDGKFYFTPKSAPSVTAYEFFGVGSFDTNYGHTVKKINNYGNKYSNYYSRVELKFNDDDTFTSTVVKEVAMQVAGGNDAWNLGQRTLKIENLWLDSTTANTLANDIFTNVSSLQRYVQFTTTFIPHIELLSKVKVSYDSSEVDPVSLWDIADWDEMVWDANIGNPIKLTNKETTCLSVEIDLDKLETVFTGSEV